MVFRVFRTERMDMAPIEKESSLERAYHKSSGHLTHELRFITSRLDGKNPNDICCKVISLQIPEMYTKKLVSYRALLRINTCR